MGVPKSGSSGSSPFRSRRLAQLITASPVFTPGVENGLKLPLYMPELAFAGLITMVPMLALFAYAQRYLSKGVAMGGLTG